MAKNLVSMKMSKKESKEEFGPVNSESEGPKFPFGLSVRLNNESMDKLGLGSMPKVGSEMQLTALVNVESTEESERADGGSRKSMTLQITSMGLDTGKSDTDKEKAEILFGGDK